MTDRPIPLSSGKVLRQTAEDLAVVLGNDMPLAFVAVTDSQASAALSAALAMVTGKYWSRLRTETKWRGTKSRVEGYRPQPADTVCLVITEDCASEQVRESRKALVDLGCDLMEVRPLTGMHP